MAKRYLVMKLRHHGDVLLVTPLIAALKKQDPDCEVDVLIYQETRDMVAANSHIKHIHVIDRKWKKLGTKEQLKHEVSLVRAVKQRHYDVVICLADQWRAALLAKVSGAKKRIGIAYPSRNNRLWQSCFTDLIPELSTQEHIVEQNLLALTPLNIPAVATEALHMQYHPQDAEHVQELLREEAWQGEPYVVMHPGSRWFFKCWDDDKTIAIAQKLLNQGLTVVLSAAPDARELEMIEAIQSKLDVSTGRLCVLAGNMNLRELAALIDGADLFIGVDSVPMHMAAAFATPCVALFGPTWLERWRPWSDNATVVYAGDFGQLPHPNSIDVSTETRYLSAIPIDAVWQAIQTYLPLGEAR